MRQIKQEILSELFELLNKNNYKVIEKTEQDEDKIFQFYIECKENRSTKILICDLVDELRNQHPDDFVCVGWEIKTEFILSNGLSHLLFSFN